MLYGSSLPLSFHTSPNGRGSYIALFGYQDERFTMAHNGSQPLSTMIPSAAMRGPHESGPQCNGRSSLSQEARPTLGRCLSTALRARAALQGDSADGCATVVMWSLSVVGQLQRGLFRLTGVTPEDFLIKREIYGFLFVTMSGRGNAVDQFDGWFIEHGRIGNHHEQPCTQLLPWLRWSLVLCLNIEHAGSKESMRPSSSQKFFSSLLMGQSGENTLGSRKAGVQHFSFTLTLNSIYTFHFFGFHSHYPGTLAHFYGSKVRGRQTHQPGRPGAPRGSGEHNGALRLVLWITAKGQNQPSNHQDY